MRVEIAWAKVDELFGQNYSYPEIGRKYGVSNTTIRRIHKKEPGYEDDVVVVRSYGKRKFTKPRPAKAPTDNLKAAVEMLLEAMTSQGVASVCVFDDGSVKLVESREREFKVR